MMHVDFKRYTAGDQRQNTDLNLDDRERVSKITFDLRDMNLQPLQRERFVFLLGPRYNPEKPHKIKIVTKQYATYIENYFKGMETIKELYWEALRAPMDAVNFSRNPYLREAFKKRRLGKTKAERVIKLAQLAKERKARYARVEVEQKQAAEKGIGTPLEHKERNVKYAIQRRKLGFIDLETTADGKTILAEEGMGVDDPVMHELEIKSTRYQKKVQEQRARKKLEIVTPIQGISRAEYEESMLKPNELFKDV